MIKHISIFCAVLCIAAYSATAQNVDHVFTKDGSVYEGYISEQIPGSKITVKTEKATLFVNSSDVSDLAYENRYVEELPKRLGEWAKSHYPKEGRLRVASLNVGGKRYSDVVVLESGVRYKLLSFEDDTFNLAWADIVKTTKTQDDISENVNDVVKLKNGQSLTGHVIEQIIGYEIRIRTLEGEINAVSFPDIVSVSSQQTDKTRALRSDCRFIDRVELNDGSSVEGFITSRIMGRHLVMETSGNVRNKEIPLSDIAKYVKIPNPDYNTDCGSDSYEYASAESERFDREAEEEVAVNRESEATEKEVDNDNDRESDNYAVAENRSKDENTVYLNGLPMTLNSIETYEFNKYVVKEPVTDAVSANTEIRIEMPDMFNMTNLKIVKTHMTFVSIASSGNGSSLLPSFEQKDANKSKIEFGISNAGNGNVVLSTIISEPGTYILYPVANMKMCIVFNVQ